MFKMGWSKNWSYCFDGVIKFLLPPILTTTIENSTYAHYCNKTKHSLPAILFVPFERRGSMKLHERIWLRQLEPTGCFYICVQNNLICFLFFVFICCDVFFYHWCGVGRRVLFWQGGGLVCQRLSAVVNADLGGVQVLWEGEASTLTPNCLGSTIPVLTGYGLLLCSNVQHYHFVVQKMCMPPFFSSLNSHTLQKARLTSHTIFWHSPLKQGQS